MFTVFLDHAAGDEVLEFFVSAESEHFFAAADGVAEFEIFVNGFKKVIELVDFLLHQCCDQFVGNVIGQAAGKPCSFCGSHREGG